MGSQAAARASGRTIPRPTSKGAVGTRHESGVSPRARSAAASLADVWRRPHKRDGARARPRAQLGHTRERTTGGSRA